VEEQNTRSEDQVTQRLAELWAVLQMQRRVVVLVTGGVCALALVGSLLSTPIYRSTTVLHVSPVWGHEMAVAEVQDNDANRMRNTRQFYRTQMEIMLSKPVLQEVVDRFVEMYPGTELASGNLRNLVSIEPVNSSELLTLSVRHPDPAKAAALSSLLTEVYQRHNLEARRVASRNARMYLDEQLERYGQRIIESTRQLIEYQAQHDLGDAQEQVTELSVRMARLSTTKGELAAQRVMLEALVKNHEAMLAARNYSELGQQLGNAIVASTAQAYATAVADRARAGSRYGELHPEWLAAQALVEKLEGELRRLISDSISAERLRLRMLQEQEAGLEGALGTAKSQTLAREGVSADYERLRIELEQAKEFHQALRERAHELELASQTQLNNVRVIEEAQPSDSPVSPNLPLNLAIALFTGLAGGVLLALARHYFDDRLATPEEVARLLRVPFLGLVPEIKEARDGRDRALFTHFKPRSAAAEAIRSIRTVLDMSPLRGPEPLRRLLVTSAIASEGKTDTVVRLGVAYADLGRRVLLVDADLRRARLHRVFGVERGDGLVGLLTDSARIEDVVMATEAPNVFLLPAGQAVDRPAELLSSLQMQRLMVELGRRFDLVVIDTPPVGLVSDGLALSRYADGVVIVVRDQAVGRNLVRDAVERLRQVGAPLMGVVVNAVVTTSSAARYRYYYGYRHDYGRYEEPGESAAK
jgi:capsular exopolysaccharide synthesis family protein